MVGEVIRGPVLVPDGERDTEGVRGISGADLVCGVEVPAEWVAVQKGLDALPRVGEGGRGDAVKRHQ